MKKLGARLVEVGYLDGSKTNVLCENAADSYQVRLIVRAGVENDPEVNRLLKVAANDLSEQVFSNQRVAIHPCNSCLKTIRKLVSD